MSIPPPPANGPQPATDPAPPGPVGWVLDLDGVVYLGDHVIPGAPEAIAHLRSAGHPVLFVTNNSSARLEDVEGKLERMGIPAAGAVVTSAIVAAELVSPDEVALVCGGPGVEQALLDRGVAVVREGDADVVVVGYHRDFNYERMTVASTAVRRGARLLATNDDATYPTPDGPIPGGGAILASIAVASGVKPIVAGKGHMPIVAHVRRRIGANGIMVGDRPDTDGRFARSLGYRFALVLSGVTRSGDLPVEPAPDLIAGDLAAAVEAELR